jgi:hypothetical protein
MFVWTISDVVGVVVLIIVTLAFLVMYAAIWVKQALCKHRGDIRKTRACDAICCDCGKNLGFIGDQRRNK